MGLSTSSYSLMPQSRRTALLVLGHAGMCSAGVLHVSLQMRSAHSGRIYEHWAAGSHAGHEHSPAANE